MGTIVSKNTDRLNIKRDKMDPDESVGDEANDDILSIPLNSRFTANGTGNSFNKFSGANTTHSRPATPFKVVPDDHYQPIPSPIESKIIELSSFSSKSNRKFIEEFQEKLTSLASFSKDRIEPHEINRDKDI